MKTRSPLLLVSISLMGCFIFLGFNNPPYKTLKTSIAISDSNSVWDIFEKLGRKRLNSIDPSIKGVSAKKGYDIVHKGVSEQQYGKGKTKLQSPYFKCTACHNTVKEFADLSQSSPQERLDYAISKKLPFLQGTSFYGIVNRTNFYNDDYQKKYAGVLYIKESNADIRKAIQVCAMQCSQGRRLKDWEIESVLAYFWTLELQFDDLTFAKDELQRIQDVELTKTTPAEIFALLDGKFMQKSSAHFVAPIKAPTLSDELKNDKKRLANGEAIYNLSCKHCHAEKRYSFFALDDSKHSFRYLKRQVKKGGKHSLFNITREGTYPLKGKRAYMPHYPMEKLSDRQLEDLYLYIERASK
jgi:mono/diheme cytochrome c family protein